MIFLGNFLLSFLFVLSCRAEDISPLRVRSISDDQKQTIKVFHVETIKQTKHPELYRSGFRSKNSKIENAVVPNVFILNRVNSQNSRQERAIDQIPPHKAFHEFHHEPVRPRVPGRRRTTRPGRPPSDTPAPRRFPEGDQYTVDERLRPTLPATRRTRRPTTTVKYSHASDAQTKKTRPTTPDTGIIRSTRPFAVTDVSHDGRGRPTRRTTTSGKPLRTSGTSRNTRKPGVTEPAKRTTVSGKPSRTSGAARGTRRPGVTESAKRTSISGKPYRTSGETRGTRRPGVSKPSGQFPPHKDFHDFHYEPVKPMVPGRRRTTVQPRATRFPDDAHHSVTPAPRTTALIRESSKPRASTKHPDEQDISKSASPFTPRRTSKPSTQPRLANGQRVTQRRKTTSAVNKKTTSIPDRHDKVNEKPEFLPKAASTPRPGVTRRHTDRGHRRSKKPTSIPSEFTRGATRSQSITQTSKALPPHRAFHEFHSEPIKTKIPDSKTSEMSAERTTPIYPMLDVAPSQRPSSQGERHRPASSQRPRTGKPRFLNGKQPNRSTDQQRKTTPGRRRTTVRPEILLGRSDVYQRITTRGSRPSSTPTQRRPPKRPQKDFDMGDKVKPSSPSPRQFPSETRRPGTSKPLPPHKAFHEFHFEPVRPRRPGYEKTNGTPRPVLPSRYTNGEFTAQKRRPVTTTHQSIWPRIPGGDSRFITQQPVLPSVNFEATRQGTLPRFTPHQRPGPTAASRTQAISSTRPGGKKRKPTNGTKRPETSYRLPEENTLTTLQTPFQFTDENKRKPTRRTQKTKSRPSDDGGPSVETRPLPPHKAFHDFHYDSVKPKVPEHRVTSGARLGTSKPVPSSYPGERRRTQKQRPTPTLSHEIQPRFPDGDKALITQKPDLTSGTQKPRTSQKHPNGQKRKPTSSTKRPGSRSRRPNGRRPTPAPEGTLSTDTETSSQPVTLPIFPGEDQVTPTPAAQGQSTQSRISSDHRTQSTPDEFRPRAKPRFPGDRGTRPTSAFPDGRRRTQRPRHPSDAGSTDQPIKFPSHKAFHEFHYAPVRPRFLAGS